MTTLPNPEVAKLADRMLALTLEAEPLDASLMGFRDYDAYLADLSIGAKDRLAGRRADIRASALLIDPSTLTHSDAITREVIIASCDYGDDADFADALAYTVAALPVSPSSFTLAYVRMVVVTNEQEAADYLLRLAALPGYLAQAEERLSLGRASGLTPVQHLVQQAVDQIDRFLSSEPNPMAIDPPPAGNGTDAWLAERDRLLASVVRPAFLRHRDVLLEEVKPTARSQDTVGLVHLPDGRERYRRLVRLHTTTERTPEELHQMGLDVIAGIHDEFVALGAALFGMTELPDVFAYLTDNADLRWNSSQEIIDAAEQAVRRAELASSEWFGHLPDAVCALDAIPELEADGAPAAYYLQPALDGSRPGTYYSNVSNPQERTTFDLESVAFHEAVPGHHFQISLALEHEDLPMLRRLSLFTAYVEGWGLYSERLADEMGLYSSALQRMGMLAADAWRAGRLVVDTGMHALGWSRQHAVDYLLENTPEARIEVESEVDRYIAMPGQALAYMVGRLEIQSLRGRAQAALGERFDVKDFHDVVLGSGALPLAVLAAVVDDWLVSK